MGGTGLSLVPLLRERDVKEATERATLERELDARALVVHRVGPESR